MLVMIGTDCTGGYKSNYHTITTATAVFFDVVLFHLRVTFCFHHVFFGVKNLWNMIVKDLKLII
jgi:hypothetical protein